MEAAARGWAQGNGHECSLGTVPVGDEEALEMEDRDGCTTV